MRAGGPGDNESDGEEEDLLAPETEDTDDELEGEPTRRSPQPVPED